MKTSQITLAATLLACGVAHAQTANPGGTALAKAAHAHVVSGAIAEADWQQAELLTSFVQREPSEGTPATYQTEAASLLIRRPCT